MKRHKTHEHNLLGERMCDEFNEARRVRDLALIAHLYLEYYVNELVVAKFKAPAFIIDDGELGSFHGKLTLLKALGIWEGVPHVLANTELIQRIRNFYAHNLLLTDEVPATVSSRIQQLEYFENGRICEYDVPWSDHADPLLSQLQVCATATTNGLIELQESLA